MIERIFWVILLICCFLLGIIATLIIQMTQPEPIIIREKQTVDECWELIHNESIKMKLNMYEINNVYKAFYGGK